MPYTITNGVLRFWHEYQAVKLCPLKIYFLRTEGAPEFDKAMFINPYLTNRFYHHYQLGESTCIFRGLGVIFISAFCGVTSGAMLFANVPQKGHQA